MKKFPHGTERITFVVVSLLDVRIKCHWRMHLHVKTNNSKVNRRFDHLLYVMNFCHEA